MYLETKAQPIPSKSANGKIGQEVDGGTSSTHTNVECNEDEEPDESTKRITVFAEQDALVSKNKEKKTVEWYHPSRPLYRFSIMLLSSLMLTGVYMSYDSIGAISPYLKDSLAINDRQYGTLVAVYALPNVILAFLAGVITDRFGYNRTSVVYSAIVLLGNIVIATAENYNYFLVGRFIFGLGGESLFVSQTSVLSRWFSGKELGFAFGFSVSFSMLGSLFAYWILPIAAEVFGFRFAFWMNVAMCMFSLIINVLLSYMDYRAADYLKERDALISQEKSISQGKNLFHPAYWLTILICLMFYGAMTFMSYMNVLLNEDYGYSTTASSRLTSLVYVFGLLLSAPFGWAVDIYGHRMLLMVIGMFSLIPTFLLFTFTRMNPIPLIIVLGVSYSLVPAVFWTLIPLIVDEKYIGKAYGISYSLYDGIIFICPIIYGHLLTITGEKTAGLMLFTGFLVLGALATVALWVLDKKLFDSALQRPSPGTTKPNLDCLIPWKRKGYERMQGDT